MDLTKVLAQLHAELENLDAAIASLERIEQGSRRRGRPPLWISKTRAKERDGPAAAQEPQKERNRR